MKSCIKSLMVALGLMFVAMNVTACNTTEGVGKDVEKAGDSLKDAARDAKN